MVIAFEEKKTGVGVDFVNWVCVEMKNTKSCVSYSGCLSDCFIVESEIRQGCPCSLPAFVLAVEMLFIKIRDCTDVKGRRNWSTVNNVRLAAA